MKNSCILFLIFSLSLTLSCSKENKDNSEETSGCKNEVINRNDSIIITGCSDFEPSLTFTNSNYLLTMNEKTENSIDFAIFQKNLGSYMGYKVSSASALRNDGWYSQDGIHGRMEGTWKWRVTATDRYRIVFVKLPLAKTPASLPVSYNSQGQVVLGPIRIAQPSATFTITCPNTSLAGFNAELYTAAGKEVLAPNYYNILDATNLDKDNKLISNYSKTITLQLPEGNYLLKVASNKNALWTVKIN
jgi:hypothetical protein